MNRLSTGAHYHFIFCLSFRLYVVMADKENTVPPRPPPLNGSLGTIQLKADLVTDEWNDELEDELADKRRDALTREAPKPDVCGFVLLAHCAQKSFWALLRSEKEDGKGKKDLFGGFWKGKKNKHDNKHDDEDKKLSKSAPKGRVQKEKRPRTGSKLLGARYGHLVTSDGASKEVGYYTPQKLTQIRKLQARTLQLKVLSHLRAKTLQE